MLMMYCTGVQPISPTFLIACAEADLAALAEARQFPIIPCDLCGSQDNLKRQRMKTLIEELHLDNPNVRGNLLAALSNVRPTQLLDQSLRRVEGSEGQSTTLALDLADEPEVPALGIPGRRGLPVLNP